MSALVQLPPSQSHPGSMVHELLHLRQGRREPRHFSQETENFEQSTGSPLFLSAPPTLPRAGTRPDTIPRFKIYIQVEYLHPNACSTPSRTPFPARTMQWPVNSCNAQTVTRLGKTWIAEGVQKHGAPVPILGVAIIAGLEGVAAETYAHNCGQRLYDPLSHNSRDAETKRGFVGSSNRSRSSLI